MMRMKAVVFAGLLAFGYAQAMEGEFDRSSEINQYITQLNSNATQEELIPTVRAIHISGIGDEQLAKAISDRLLRELPNLETQFGAWTVRALAATGEPLAKDTLEQVRKTTRVVRVRDECLEQIPQIDWYKQRNLVMASRRNYQEGDNMRVAQLLNLLQSDDYTFKKNGAYRMNWDKILDARLMTEIAAQLQAFVDRGAATKSADELLAMIDYTKLLGYSRDQQYRELLKRLSSSTQPKLKKTAVKALQTLNS